MSDAAVIHKRTVLEYTRIINMLESTLLLPVIYQPYDLPFPRLCYSLLLSCAAGNSLEVDGSVIEFSLFLTSEP
jgi:hypothetical protein